MIERQSKKRIVLAEDDDEMRLLVARKLRLNGYEVVECRDGEELLEQIAAAIGFADTPKMVSLIITDIRMPRMNAMHILAQMSHAKKMPAIIVITAFGDRDTHTEALALGAAAVFDKPFDIDVLVGAVKETVGI